MKKTYQSLKRDLALLQERVALLDRLVGLGVPQYTVNHYRTPDITSGYSMGESVSVFCGDTLIETVDRTEQYAKSCKWRPTHGHIHIVFNKAQLRKYVGLLHDIQESELGQREQMFRELHSLTAQCIDTEKSRIKRKL